MSWWQKLKGGGKPAPIAVESEVPPAQDWRESLSAPALLNFGALPAIAEQRAADYANADPFPHIMLEDFISPAAIERVLAEFPRPEDQLSWRKIRAESKTGDLVQYNKLGMAAIDEMPPAIRELLLELNSGTFLRFLERLTGINGLIADPKLRGGGIHQVLPGGVLGVHAEFTNHADYHLDRRLNVLLYFNQDRPEADGGDLELRYTELSRC